MCPLPVFLLHYLDFNGNTTNVVLCFSVDEKRLRNSDKLQMAFKGSLHQPIPGFITTKLYTCTSLRYELSLVLILRMSEITILSLPWASHLDAEATL